MTKTSLLLLISIAVVALHVSLAASEAIRVPHSGEHNELEKAGARDCDQGTDDRCKALCESTANPYNGYTCAGSVDGGLLVCACHNKCTKPSFLSFLYCIRVAFLCN